MRFLGKFFSKSEPEKRASSYTDLIIAGIHARANGNIAGDVRATAALEIAAGTISRAFSSATASGPARLIEPLGPEFLGQVGRQLIRRGQAVFAIRVVGGRVSLAPAASWDVTGGQDPESWRWRLDLFGPSRNETINLPDRGVLNFMYSFDPERPFDGVSPMGYAHGTGKLHSAATGAVSDESSGPRGYVLPMPFDGDKDEFSLLKKDIAGLKGGVSLVQSTADGYAGEGVAPKRDWQTMRIGADFPPTLVDALGESGKAVLAACGCPVELVDPGPSTASRESHRRFLHGTLAPLGRLASAELTRKFESEIRLSFEKLYASDLSGRARAFQSMVNGGMAVEKAAGLAGLLEPEE